MPSTLNGIEKLMGRPASSSWTDCRASWLREASYGSGPKLKRTTTSISEAADTCGAVNVNGWPIAAATPLEMIRPMAAVSKSDRERTSCDESWHEVASASGVRAPVRARSGELHAAPRRWLVRLG